MTRRHEALRDRLIREKKLETLHKTVDHSNHHPEAHMEVTKLIPCILHLEICYGINTFSMVLANGLDIIKNQPQFVSQLEDSMQMKIIGDVDSPVDWFFPWKMQRYRKSLPTLISLLMPA
jgi:hypothetical protein